LTEAERSGRISVLSEEVYKNIQPEQGYGIMLLIGRYPEQRDPSTTARQKKRASALLGDKGVIINRGVSVSCHNHMPCNAAPKLRLRAGESNKIPGKNQIPALHINGCFILKEAERKDLLVPGRSLLKTSSPDIMHKLKAANWLI
ncbi:MAG: hypothetical protein WD139_00375, partial [Balneolaceae bacterium]